MFQKSSQVMVIVAAFAASLAAAEIKQPEWGKFAEDATRPGGFTADVKTWPANGRLALPTPFPHLVRAWRQTGEQLEPLSFEFNTNATELTLLVGEAAKDPARLLLETSENTQQFADGRFVFSALDAKVVGETAKLESHPGSHRIGFWSNEKDYVTWNYTASRWGMYRVYLTYSTASPAGTRIELHMGEAKLSGTLESTGSWYSYHTLDLGKLYLSKAGPQVLEVKCVEKKGGAVMNLKAVVLAPECEGTPPVQADDGVVTLHGRDATVQGVNLRYEPDPKKITLGYWTKPTDTASWQFTLKQAGMYNVEVSQGCGTGQGGSEVGVSCGDQQLSFVVEDTGHFQNFKPRVIGQIKLEKPGQHTLRIAPVKIAKAAALDVQQVRLLPVK